MVRPLSSFSPQWIEHMRQAYKASIERDGGVWENLEYKYTFERIMANLVPYTEQRDLPWEITLIDNTKKGTAWSMSTGKIAVYRNYIRLIVAMHTLQGLYRRPALLKMNSDPDVQRLKKEVQELSSYGRLYLDDIFAYTVAHEMSHVELHHHSKERIFNRNVCLPAGSIILTAGSFLFFPAGIVLRIILPCLFLGSELIGYRLERQDEFAADRNAIQLMAKAGYDPKAALWDEHVCMIMNGTTWYATLKNWLENWLESHPLPSRRLEANKVTLDLLERGIS